MQRHSTGRPHGPDTPMTHTILIVDDEKHILSALRRSLRAQDWRLRLASSAEEGLGILAAERVDIVVSDVRMPVIDGLAFLKEVKARYPHIVRLALTGHAGLESVKQAITEETALQILVKPWSDEHLREVLQTCLEQAARHRGLSESLQRAINSVTSLPVLPRIAVQLSEVIRDGSGASASRIAAIVGKEPAYSARLLRWANSALFGLRHEVHTVRRAVVVLGAELVEGLVLSMSAQDAMAADTPEIPGLGREAFQRHCQACAVASGAIAEAGRSTGPLPERAFTAGLLHDIGKLLEDRFCHDDLARAVSLAHEDGQPLLAAEQKVLGTTHAEIGAYLAQWWDLPPSVVEAARWHHAPGKASKEFADLVAVVHLADWVVQKHGIGASGNGRRPQVDFGCLARLGLSSDGLDDVGREIGARAR